MKKPISLLLMLIASIGIVQGADYDYLEAGYLQGETGDDFLPVDFDGWELHGSRNLDDWLLVGGYERLTTDAITLVESLELQSIASFLRAGAGRKFELGERFTLAPGVGFVRASEKIEFSGFCTACDYANQSESDTGYFVNFELRMHVVRGVEAAFEHRFTNVLSERLNDWRIDIRYRFTPALAAGIGYRDFEGDTALAAALRWHF